MEVATQPKPKEPRTVGRVPGQVASCEPHSQRVAPFPPTEEGQGAPVSGRGRPSARGRVRGAREAQRAAATQAGLRVSCARGPAHRRDGGASLAGCRSSTRAHHPRQEQDRRSPRLGSAPRRGRGPSGAGRSAINRKPPRTTASLQTRAPPCKSCNSPSGFARISGASGCVGRSSSSEARSGSPFVRTICGQPL